MRSAYAPVKRVLDVLVAVVSLVVLSVPLCLLTVVVWWIMGDSPFFRQTRPGRGGSLFVMWKFRTMSEKRGSDGLLLADSERITPFGNWLRSTSLDELPELWNVLKGEMSVVGPRPLLMQYLPLYSERQARRHEVRPGITGWAQVNGRNALSWDQKFELDVWYVDNRSLWLDIKIIWMTLRKVVLREGISAAGEATMPAFTGSAPSSHEKD